MSSSLLLSLLLLSLEALCMGRTRGTPAAWMLLLLLSLLLLPVLSIVIRTCRSLRK
jgi:hypothetical protein